MRLLVLGGTKFLGRAVVQCALQRGHEVTLFNRGQTNPDLFPEVERLRGDREGDLDALRGRGWDAVVDPSGYVPRVVRRSAELMAEAVGHYVFISSVSVYADFSGQLRESDPLAPLDPEHSADELREDYGNYGPLKALCEEVVAEVFPGGHASVRAGLLVGPHDPTGRFTYWPHRVARGGDVLAPAPSDRKVQFIDVRDLATWIVELCERHTVGTFNATHPGVTWGDLLEACTRVAGGATRFVWVPDRFLVEAGVGEWTELPLWIGDPQWRGLHQADVSRALAAGLTFRPLDETVRGALEEAEPTADAGLTREREAELLEKSDSLGGSFLSVLGALVPPKLLLMFGSAALYCATLLLFANVLDLWDLTATKASVYWFLGTGVVLIGNATQAPPGESISLKKLLRGALKLTILVEFLVNLYVFPFGVELVLVPVIFLFVVLQIVDQYKPTDPRVTQFVNGVLGVVGLGLMTYVAVGAIGDLEGFLTRENAEDLLVAPALTLALVPFLYGVAWVSRREQENLRRPFRSLSNSPV